MDLWLSLFYLLACGMNQCFLKRNPGTVLRMICSQFYSLGQVCPSLVLSILHSPTALANTSLHHNDTPHNVLQNQLLSGLKDGPQFAF